MAGLSAMDMKTGSSCASQRVKDFMLLVLPETGRGRKFIAGLAKGSELSLGGGKDKIEATYPITGASVAMAALSDCEKLFLGRK
jgi:hypothetical protein